MIEQLRRTFVDVLRSGTGFVHPGLLYVVVTLVIAVGITFETINYYYYCHYYYYYYYYYSANYQAV